MLGEEVTPATRRYNMLRGGNTSYPETEHAKGGWGWGWGWQQLPGDTRCYKGGGGRACSCPEVQHAKSG